MLGRLSLTDSLTEPGQPPAHGRGPAQGPRAGAALAEVVLRHDVRHRLTSSSTTTTTVTPRGTKPCATWRSATQPVVRAGESVYRYGGEEFLLVMPNCTERDAVLAGERIRQAVAELALVHDFKPTTPPVVTVSGGVTSWTIDSALSVDDVLKLADEALFEAKSSGRNRIEVSRTSVDVVLQDAQ